MVEVLLNFNNFLTIKYSQILLQCKSNLNIFKKNKFVILIANNKQKGLIFFKLNYSRNCNYYKNNSKLNCCCKINFN